MMVPFKGIIFLDRDGVINHDPGDYTAHLTEFHLLPGVIPALKKWSDNDFGIIVVTNQGGIAKGIYTMQDFFQIDEFMQEAFRKEGINFLETFFCPHHENYSRCICRKPQSGMVQKAIAKYNLDPGNCVMIGDKQRDLDCAWGAGVKGKLIPTNSSIENIDPVEILRNG